MYLLVLWRDASIEAVEGKERLKRRVRELYSDFDAIPDEWVSCIEVEDCLKVPAVSFHGSTAVYELLEKLGFEFEPLTVFLRKRGLLDEELKSFIVSKLV